MGGSIRIDLVQNVITLRHMSVSWLGVGALGGFVSKEIFWSSVECSGTGVEDDRSDTRFVTCMVELIAPSIGVILMDTCTSGFGAVRAFFVGGWSNFFVFGRAYFVAVPSDCKLVSILPPHLSCLYSLSASPSAISWWDISQWPCLFPSKSTQQKTFIPGFECTTHSRWFHNSRRQSSCSLNLWSGSKEMLSWQWHFYFPFPFARPHTLVPFACVDLCCKSSIRKNSPC